MPNVLDSTLFKAMGSFLLNRVDLITTREPITFEFLKEIGVAKPPMFCTGDKAFLLDPISKPNAKKLTKRIGIDRAKKPLVGIMLVKGSNVFKAAFGSKYQSTEEKYDRHAEEIAIALDRLYNAIGGTLIFMPHSIGPHSEVDDRLVHREVVKRLGERCNAIILEDDLQPTELKALMSQFDITITERTHGGIASATMMVPTLWISHPTDVRTYGIVGKTLDMSDCLYDITGLNGETLFHKILWLWNNRESMKPRLKAKAKNAKNLAMRNSEYFRKYIVSRIEFTSE